MIVNNILAYKVHCTVIERIF